MISVYAQRASTNFWFTVYYERALMYIFVCWYSTNAHMVRLLCAYGVL